MPQFCEMCGKMVNEPLVAINHYGEKLLVCKECQNQLRKKSVQQPEQRLQAKPSQQSRPWEPQYDVVDNYAQIIKETREKANISIPDLASRLGIKESVLRRIEAGKLQPDIDTARRLERFLRIQLLIKPDNTQTIKNAELGNVGLELRHVAKIKDKE